MTHTLRKYLSNRGSALFMVLSTMTALLIAVMAMYFSVVSSRSVQYAVFNQNQSYQSAVSVQEALRSWLNANDKSDLVTQMKALEEGKTLTTNGNGFAALGVAGGSEDLNQLGSYDVNITKVKPEVVGGVTCTTFDVATTVVVGGVRETVHIYWHIPPAEKEDAKINSDIFASTGYVPNNADVASGKFNTKSVFDNEFVNFGNGTTEYKLYGDIFCGGSVAMYDAKTVTLSKASTFVVRDSLYLYRADNLTLGTDSEKGKLYVGGDLYVNNTFKLAKFDVYVLGNVYVSSSGDIQADKGCYLHVNGDYYKDNPWGAGDSGNFKRVTRRNGKFIVNGVENTDSNYTCDPWGEADVKAAASFIDTSTQSYEFGNWKIENNFPSTPIKIEFDSSANVYEQEINFSGGSDKTCYTNLGDIRDKNPGGDKNYTLFIDTGDDEENKHYLRVNANYDANSDLVDDTFCWNPLGLQTTNNTTQRGMNIIVRGKGSLIIDIPNGVRYATSTWERFMHEGWFILLGGQTNPNGGYSFNAANMMDSALNPSKFIHEKCPDGCCTYDVDQLTTKCSKCGTYLKEVSCEDHNYHRKFCPNTECENNANEPDKNEDGDYTGLCANRIDRPLVDAYLNSHPAIKTKFEERGIEYPNCNIFLVSCDESAAIYIADYPVVDTSGEELYREEIASSTYFGFVYAPYMTYGGFHESETNSLRFCGGMVVSDYIFNDNSWYVNCYPDYLPSELGASGALPHDAKAWKIIVGRN